MSLYISCRIILDDWYQLIINWYNIFKHIFKKKTWFNKTFYSNITNIVDTLIKTILIGAFT